MSGVDPVVNFPPGGDRDPHHYGPAQQQHDHLPGQEKFVPEGRRPAGEHNASLIRQGERQRGQQDVGDREEQPDFAMVAAKHVKPFLDFSQTSFVRLAIIISNV